MSDDQCEIPNGEITYNIGGESVKKATIGVLAHVDAGKTTLMESMLYLSHVIRKRGRVDHGDAFLDYDNQERKRGITIFSSIARIENEELNFTFIDTPGHIDFSGEMERSLSILDYAILVIDGSKGIQPHSETIYKLLEDYHIPTFIFINKMDLSLSSINDLISDLNKK